VTPPQFRTSLIRLNSLNGFITGSGPIQCGCWHLAPVAVIVAGYSSVKTLKRIIRSYEQMQGPKFVIGLGICTINGGMYWDSYNTIKRLDRYIPVDLYITGCMPRPEALLAGFMELKRKIKAGECDGANRYVKDFDWYKANQKKVIKKWDMPDYNW